MSNLSAVNLPSASPFRAGILPAGSRGFQPRRTPFTSLPVRARPCQSTQSTQSTMSTMKVIKL